VKPSPPSRTERLAALARRQQGLLLRSAALRSDLGHDLQRLQAPLALADRVRAGWLWLRAHPQAPLAAAVVLVVLRPRRAWRWGLRLWWGWRSWQRVQRWLHSAPR
jgi:hypothetical protein